MENPIYVLSVLSLMVLLAVYAGNTKWGSKFGTALLAIVFTAVVANLKLIPSASNTIPLYEGIFTYLAPISIFYLLLNVNLTSIKNAGAPMIILFLIGSFATTAGILISWYLLNPEALLGVDAKTIAGMYAGTYTGGSANFNAIALEYNFQERGILYAGSIAVDNVITTVWIIITLSIPALLRIFWKDKKVDPTRLKTSEKEKEEDSFDFRSLVWLLFLGILSFYIAEEISKWIPQVPSILILTSLAILLAQTKWVANLKGSHTLGLYLVYIFLAVIGAYCEIGSVIELREIGITLLLFASLTVFLHGLITVLLGGIFYRDWEMIAIVSQANIGGGTTALALAESFKRNELVLPAILVGSLGTALGTYIGFFVIYIL